MGSWFHHCGVRTASGRDCVERWLGHPRSDGVASWLAVEDSLGCTGLATYWVSDGSELFTGWQAGTFESDFSSQCRVRRSSAVWKNSSRLKSSWTFLQFWMNRRGLAHEPRVAIAQTGRVDQNLRSLSGWGAKRRRMSLRSGSSQRGHSESTQSELRTPQSSFQGSAVHQRITKQKSVPEDIFRMAFILY